MEIAVIGCGAIGAMIAAALNEAAQLTVVVRPWQKGPLDKDGLIIEEEGKIRHSRFRSVTQLDKPVDTAVFAVKTQDLKEAVLANQKFLKGAVALSTQNGVRADYILADFFPPDKIITGLVMFGATFYPPNRVVNNFKGELILGNIFGAKVPVIEEIVSLFGDSFPVKADSGIKGMKYLKLFINLNNCLPAVLGKSMQEVYADYELAKLAIAINREAYRIASQAKIELKDLPTYPCRRLVDLVSMPLAQAAKVFSQIMVNLSRQPLYGSLLQSIRRGKLSEIDYLNGEIIRLAKETNQHAPLNEKIVELVHKVERDKKFFSKEELSAQLKGLMPEE